MWNQLLTVVAHGVGELPEKMIGAAHAWWLALSGSSIAACWGGRSFSRWLTVLGPAGLLLLTIETSAAGEDEVALDREMLPLPCSAGARENEVLEPEKMLPDCLLDITGRCRKKSCYLCTVLS
ncbi:hypothetical protein OIU74_002744 [Salix koriyanagi]|uniref:Uncharacterized protein n=1 Tax=Salix koriyanagi TaxID=2511006 RepID=A0A9Q0X5P1_9ROSI|nr:hypothetical protein OIU74_002744 [Salix koriyanagi]